MACITNHNITTIIDWILTEKCNLNCYYCLQNKDTRTASCKKVDFDFVAKMCSPVLFHLTGGEPFLVPNLVELINKLQSLGHYVSMNTNLTHPTQNFSQSVRTDHFLFVNASYHYIYRKNHITPFVRNYKMLRDSGLFTYATIVMIPQLLDDLCIIAERLISEGVCVLPKQMRGRDHGKNYPQDYDSEQIQRMHNLLKKSKLILSNDEKMKFEEACLYNVSIDDWKSGTISYGTRCFDGNRYVRITESGDVVFCNGQSLGNVYQEGFRFQLSDQKKGCPYKTKKNLCKKYY